ncbi:MAG: hypothetical protein ABJI69_09965 [Balneola sp.]
MKVYIKINSVCMELHKCGVRVGDCFEAVHSASNKSYRFISPDKSECIVWKENCIEVSETDYKVSQISTDLKKAISAKSKKEIGYCYDRVINIDLEDCSDDVFNEYDKLVTKGNEVLFS